MRPTGARPFENVELFAADNRVAGTPRPTRQAKNRKKIFPAATPEPRCPREQAERPGLLGERTGTAGTRVGR